MAHQFTRWLRELPLDVDTTLDLLAADSASSSGAAAVITIGRGRARHGSGSAGSGFAGRIYRVNRASVGQLESVKGRGRLQAMRSPLMRRWRQRAVQRYDTAFDG